MLIWGLGAVFCLSCGSGSQKNQEIISPDSDSSLLVKSCRNITESILLEEDIVICGKTHKVDIGVNEILIEVSANADDITISCDEGAVLDGQNKAGFGIVISGLSNVTIDNCGITNFDTAIAGYGRTDYFTITNNHIYNNESYSILLDNGEEKLSDAVTISENTLENSYNHIDVTKITNSLISYNTIKDAFAYGMIFRDSQRFEVSRNAILNINKGMYGISTLLNNSNFKIHNNIISEMIDYGARVTSIDSDPPSYFTNNTINGLYPDSQVGLRLGSSVVAKNNIIVNNKIGVRGDESDSEFNYNNVWNNYVQDYADHIYESEYDISVDPEFVDPDDPLGPDNKFWTEDDGLKLNFGSPVIDAGDPSYPTELEEPDPNGGIVNLGAYGNTDLATLSCVDPYIGMEISEDTYLCPGDEPFELEVNPLEAAIKVVADNVKIKCLGTVIKGNGKGVGFLNPGHDKVTVEGCTFKEYEFGMSIINFAKSNKFKDIHLVNNNNGIRFGRTWNLCGEKINVIEDSEISNNCNKDIWLYHSYVRMDQDTFGTIGDGKKRFTLSWLEVLDEESQEMSILSDQ